MDDNKKIKNYCSVEERKFTNNDTGETIIYQVVLWHVGKTVLELKPSKQSKDALKILVEYGLVDFKQNYDGANTENLPFD